MAMIPKQPSSITFLLLALVTLSSTTTSSAAADSVGAGTISVYWGQKSESIEDNLTALCATKNYNIVILQSLLVYDNGSTPGLNLADHCGSDDKPCLELQPEIEYCQQNDIKVFLSIGQDFKTLKPENHHFEPDTTPAEKLATYLLDNFLSGEYGPLGGVYLDGIDFADVADGVNLKWPEVVRAINASTTERKIYLSASPQCLYRDAHLGDAIDTGLFDYLWVEFYYNNPSCIYSNGRPYKLLNAWKTWTSEVKNSSIFLGLTASDAIAGYIPPNTLKSDVLPIARRASNYGGVMIWDRGNDIKSNYSDQIKGHVTKSCKCVCEGSMPLSI